jgi:hypothetical protein
MNARQMQVEARGIQTKDDVDYLAFGAADLKAGNHRHYLDACRLDI